MGFVSTMVADAAAGNARSCARPAKTKTNLESAEKAIVVANRETVSDRRGGTLPGAAVCLFDKERMGEQGEGNCRRYRQTCRS